jgi:hypothetical protein
VRYAPRDIDRDGDGLVDKNDPCPSEAGPIRDTETPGCPDRAPEDLTRIAPSMPTTGAPVAAAAPETPPAPPPASTDEAPVIAPEAPAPAPDTKATP